MNIDLPETGDLTGLLNFILIEVGVSLGDRNHICGRFARLAEQRGYCVLNRLCENDAEAFGEKPKEKPLKSTA